MNPRQRTMVDEVVEVLADGLRRYLEAPGKVFHRHPAEGTGDVQNLGLAMAQAHDGPQTRSTPYRAAVLAFGQRGRLVLVNLPGRESHSTPSLIGQCRPREMERKEEPRNHNAARGNQGVMDA